LAWYMSSIEQVLLAADSSAVSLRVRLFVTDSATAPKEFTYLNPSRSNSKSANALEVVLKRPELPMLISEVVSYAALSGQASGGEGGVMIAACGPVGMIRDVQLATRRIKAKDRRLAGGVSLHTE
jgi:hypothetical protein